MKGNPISGEGEKNLYCQFYSDCLDYIAKKKSWKSWNCEKCNMKETKNVESLYLCVMNREDTPFLEKILRSLTTR